MHRATNPVRPLLIMLLAALAWLAAGASPGSAETTPEAPIDDYVREYLRTNGLPGAAIALTRNGEVVHTAGYGRQSDGTRVTDDTPMMIGSVSKTFTAFAVLQLVEDGRVDLDQPVLRYLPDLVLDDPRAAEITVRQLLTHHSGLPNPTIVPLSRSLEEELPTLAGWRLQSDPGTRYLYANINFHLAALLVQRVTDQPFEQYLAAEVFGPLGMTNSTAVATTVDLTAVPVGHVTAFGRAWPSRELEQLNSGAGGVISTAGDMGRWLAMQTGQGRIPGTRDTLLDPELLALSQTPQPDAGRHALGWDRSSPNITPERIGKSGAMTGWQAQHSLVPGSGYGVAVLLNSFTPTLEHAYELSSGIIAIAEGRQGQAEVGPAKATMIDFGLAAGGLLVLLLAAVRIARAGRWAAKRRAWAGWRYGLRLLPQAVLPAVAIGLFGVVPLIGGNASTPDLIFRLFPAGAVFLLAAAAAGLALIVARVLARVRGRAAQPAASPSSA